MKAITIDLLQSKKCAYVTFLMRNDSYLPGAMVLAHKLRKLNTPHDLVCLITKDITGQACYALNELYDHVIRVDEIEIHHKRRQERQDRPFLFTRFQVLRLGHDGDLGVGYDKIVVLDADVLPLDDYDALFDLEAPAGIINERKENCRSTSNKDTEVSLKERWIWHDIYDETCGHGQLIPKEYTERVRWDRDNMGVNACLWVLEPSMEEYHDLLKKARSETMQDLVCDSFSWPEMQYATLYWSGKWHNVDIRYCSFNGYPSISVLKGTHYAGLKPWSMNKLASVTHYCKYDDFKLWFSEYVEMMTVWYPQLKKCPRLKKLLDVYFKRIRRCLS